jgi:hypothetical protein
LTTYDVNTLFSLIHSMQRHRESCGPAGALTYSATTVAREVSMRAKPFALGYLRKDVSGTSQAWDEAQIRRLAKRLGYELSKTVTFGAGSDGPVGRLIDVVRDLDVDAVISPGLQHFDDAVPDELVQVCDLITVTPESTFSRSALSQIWA